MSDCSNKLLEELKKRAIFSEYLPENFNVKSEDFHFIKVHLVFPKRRIHICLGIIPKTTFTTSNCPFIALTKP